MWCNSGFNVIAGNITQYTGLLTQRNNSCCTNDVSALWCDIFTSVMRKVRDLIMLQEGFPTWRTYQSATAARQNEVVPLWCRVFTLLIKKVKIYSFCRNDPVLDGGIHQTSLLLANMNWFICDVIPDYHLIGGRLNRTRNPPQLIFPSKWSECFVMWYVYITDEKGERFNHVAGRIPYLTHLSKRDCCEAKWSH